MSAKKNFKEKVMKEFYKHGGGTAVEPEFTTNNPEELRKGLQASFDKIFPELMAKAKVRKHIIFDEDVFETYEGLSKEKNASLSALINSALRSFAVEKLLEQDTFRDPAEELRVLEKRERELVERIKELSGKIAKGKTG